MYIMLTETKLVNEITINQASKVDTSSPHSAKRRLIHRPLRRTSIELCPERTATDSKSASS